MPPTTFKFVLNRGDEILRSGRGGPPRPSWLRSPCSRARGANEATKSKANFNVVASVEERGDGIMKMNAADRFPEEARHRENFDLPAGQGLGRKRDRIGGHELLDHALLKPAYCRAG